MTYGSQTERYLEVDVLSRPKEWLVPLLYEHLLANLRRAAVQIETGQLEGKAASLSKASAILAELLGSLDHEQGGEIAANLSSLYSYFALEIMNASRSRDVGALQRLIEMITELHGAWLQAAEIVAPRARSATPGLKINAA
jgi:flagellar protein FliS